MVGTGARKGVGGGIVGDAQVPELRMEEPVEEVSARHPAATDSGSDGDVAEGVQALGGAPALLA